MLAMHMVVSTVLATAAFTLVIEVILHGTGFCLLFLKVSKTLRLQLCFRFRFWV